MKTKLFVLLACVFTYLSVCAVPVRPGQWKTITLASGKSVNVQFKGDERLHFWEDADGGRYVEKDGVFVKTDAETLRSKVTMHRQAVSSTMQRPLPTHKKRATSFTGKRKGLVILVEFPSKSFVSGHDANLFSRICNEIGYSVGNFKGSIKDYFLAQSGGQFELDFDVVGPVKVSQNSKYYAGSDGTDNVTELLRESCRLVEDIVDFADYDWNGDGEVEQVYLLYAGMGQHDGGGSSTIYPHEWSLEESGEGSFKIDNVYVNTYACGSELDGYSKVVGIGLMCHEFSHCLGIMDMYDTDTYGYNFGMNCWDLMDYGCYNGDAYQPCGYTSYEKWICGWLEPIELKEDTSISEMKALSEGGDAYVIYNDNYPDEYYLLENRQLTGWDASNYGAGLLVIHVDYDALIWENNVINTTGSFYGSWGYTSDFTNDHQRLTIFHADNNTLTTARGLLGDPYPYNLNNALTNTTLPAATVYNANTDGSFYMNKGIQNITQNKNGTISFDFIGQIEHVDEDVWFYESFDECNGTGGNDGRFSGSVASSTFRPDNEGWTNSKKFGGDRCAKFGTANSNGLTDSPSFVMDGEGILTFKAASFGNDGKTLDVRINDELLDVVNLSNTEWTDFTFAVSGKGKTVLSFIPDQRFFLDEVKVMRNMETGIIDLTINRSNKVMDLSYYGLDGKNLGSNWQSLPKGIYIYQGKKVVK